MPEKDQSAMNKKKQKPEQASISRMRLVRDAPHYTYVMDRMVLLRNDG